jgi:hypothetical protein
MERQIERRERERQTERHKEKERERKCETRRVKKKMDVRGRGIEGQRGGEKREKKQNSSWK